jgi:hypothetical protein
MCGPATRLLIQMLAKQSLVIYCRPPNDVLIRNVLNTDQPIPGLTEQNNVLKIAAGYDAWQVNWSGQDFSTVMSACRLHVAHFENMRKS